MKLDLLISYPFVITSVFFLVHFFETIQLQTSINPYLWSCDAKWWLLSSALKRGLVGPIFSSTPKLLKSLPMIWWVTTWFWFKKTNWTLPFWILPWLRMVTMKALLTRIVVPTLIQLDLPIGVLGFHKAIPY